MSGQFDYNNTQQLLDATADFPAITSQAKRNYGLKYIFGLIDKERSRGDADKAKDGCIDRNRQKRLNVLKGIAKLVAEVRSEGP